MSNDNNMQAMVAAAVAALQAAQNAPVPAKKDKTDWSSIDTQLDYAGKKIVLPADPEKMSLDSGIATLQRLQEDENQNYNVTEIIEGLPWDAAVAIFKAMQMIYGPISPQTVMTIFGPQHPQFVSVKIGHEDQDVIQIPIGQLKLPGVEKNVRFGLLNGGAYLQTSCKRRSRDLLLNIAILAREIIQRESIYRGKALRFGKTEEGLDENSQPTFLNLTEVSKDDVILTEKSRLMIQMNIWSVLENTQACRDHKIPLKRGNLLHGFYGTGKSLTALVSARIATDNGWTFFTTDDVNHLESLLEVAKKYQPCLVFMEDVDRAGTRDHSKAVHNLVNRMDGILSKHDEIMVVLTTNHIERIERALLRPGRFDAIVMLEAPDAETIEKLIRKYARHLLAEDADIKSVCQSLDGNIPATIREVVERSKIFMLENGSNMLQPEMLEASALGMIEHIALLHREEVKESDAEQFYRLAQSMFGVSEKTRKSIVNISDHVDHISAVVSATADRVEDTLERVQKLELGTEEEIQRRVEAALRAKKTVKKAS